MLVCHCKRLSDRDVRHLVRAGASSRGQVARRCGAGTECGGCRPLIDEILRQELRLRASAPAMQLAAAR